MQRFSWTFQLRLADPLAGMMEAAGAGLGYLGDFLRYCCSRFPAQDEVLIAGFGRRGHAVGDIPGVRFKVWHLTRAWM